MPLNSIGSTAETETGVLGPLLAGLGSPGRFASYSMGVEIAVAICWTTSPIVTKPVW